MASLPDATSRSSQAAIRFSARIARVPPGRLMVSATHEMAPFCTPWDPHARTRLRQRASSASIEQPSLCPISASEPVPEVKRTLTPRLA